MDTIQHMTELTVYESKHIVGVESFKKEVKDKKKKKTRDYNWYTAFGAMKGNT